MACASICTRRLRPTPTACATSNTRSGWPRTATLGDLDREPFRSLIRDTWNTDIVPELAPEDGNIALYKHRFSGFFETELDETLRSWSFRNLVFTGCTTSGCVESTIKDAMFATITALTRKPLPT